MDHATQDQLRSARARELPEVVSVLEVDVFVSVLVLELFIDEFEPLVSELPLAPIVLDPLLFALEPLFVPLAPIELVSFLFIELPLLALEPVPPVLALLPALFVLLELAPGEVLEELEPDVCAIA